MIARPPRSNRTDPLFPDNTLHRSVPRPHARAPSGAVPRQGSRRREHHCRFRVAGPSSARSAAHNRSSARSTPRRPTTMGTHRDAPAPSARHARAPRGQTCLSCSWLHSLNCWILLKSLGGSLLSPTLRPPLVPPAPFFLLSSTFF